MAYSIHEVAIAGDSRAITEGGHISDDECKVFALSDDTLFAETGHVRRGFDRLAAIAQKEFVPRFAVPNNPSGRAIWIGHRWGELAREGLLDLGLRRVTDGLESPIVTTGLFVFKNFNGGFELAQTYLLCGKGEREIRIETTLVVPTENLQMWASGRTEVFDEFFHPKGNRSQRSIQEATRFGFLSISPSEHYWRLPRWAVEMTIKYDRHGDVGGVIDVVEMTTSGVSWISRKKSCPTQ